MMKSRTRKHLHPRVLLTFAFLLIAPLAGAEDKLESRLSGRVVDGREFGIPDVPVELESLPAAMVVQAKRTDDAGYFQFEAEPGLYRVLAKLPGATWAYEVFVDHPRVIPPLLTVANQESEPGDNQGWMEQVEGVASPGGTVEGRVVESRVPGFGSPLAGAWTWIEGYGELARRTGADGVYRLSAPNRSGLKLQVAKEGFLTARVPAPAAREGKVVRGWTLSLHRAGYLRGRVTDVTGAPLQAEVNLRVLESSEARSEAVYPRRSKAFVDQLGHFVFPVLPGEEVELTVVAPGHSSSTQRFRTPRAGASSEVIQVELLPRLVASGEVRNERGHPIDKAVATAVPWGDDSTLRLLLAQRKVPRQDLPEGESGPDGRFLLQDLPAGSYSLVVTADGFEPVAVTGIHLEPSPETVPLGTVFLTPAASIQGQVIDPQGDPVPGAAVYVSLLDASGREALARSAEPVLADEAGEFTVPGLARGTRISLTVRRTGFLPNRIPAVPVPSEDPVVVELEPAASVTGRVTDAAGRPVAGAQVTLRPTAQRGNLLRQKRLLSTEVGGVVTDADGLFNLREVGSGSHLLEVVADCCLPEERQVEAEPGEAHTEVEVTLESGRTVTGLVVTSAGRPVAGALVTAGKKSSRSEDDGRFLVRGLPPGVTTLEATHPDQGQAERRIEVGRDDGVEIRFSEPARLTGRVVNPEGEGVSGAGVRIRCGLRAFSRPLRSGDEGEFQRIVRPGSCTVDASAPGYRPAEPRRVDIEAGETQRVVLSLDRGIVLRGQLLGADTFELAHVDLRARSSGRTLLSGRVEPDGEFEIAGLDAGIWRIVATLPDGRRADTEVEIVEGQRDAWVDLELELGRGLEGNVSLNGRPLAGAWISVASLHGQPLARTLAGPDGRFRVFGLADDRIQLDVSSPEGDLRWSRTVESGTAAPVDVEFWTGHLRGRVTEAISGVGAAGVSLKVEPLMDSTWLPTPVPSSGQIGSFGPWRLAEGHYRLTAEAPGFSPSTLDIEIQRGTELVVELSLTPAGAEPVPPES